MDISKGPREAPESEINSSKTFQEFSNGTGVALNQLRLHTMLTKDNISWIILLALAAQVFEIPAHVLAAIAGVC
jgi:hypothetical protein